MATINDAAVARLNASPDTTKHIQRSLGLPETGTWDAATDAGWASFAQTAGIDPNYGMTGDAAQWGDLQNKLATAHQSTAGTGAGVNATAMARLSADPVTTRNLQRQIGVEETGVWDAKTNAAWASYAQSIGVDPSYGLTGDHAEWADLQNKLNAGNPAMEDPAYAAYLRSMGLQQSQIKNEIIARTQAVTDSIARNRAGFEQQKEQATKNTALGFQDRGLGNSGAQYQQQDQQVGAIDYQRQQGEAEQHEALQTYTRGAQNDLSRLGTERANQELAARERIGMKRSKSVFNPAQG